MIRPPGLRRALLLAAAALAAGVVPGRVRAEPETVEPSVPTPEAREAPIEGLGRELERPDELPPSIEEPEPRAEDPERRIEELQRRIEKLEGRIEELEQRVELERPEPAEAPPPGAAAPPPAAPAGSKEARPGARQAAPPVPAPGAFEVDPAAAERALERFLVTEGALLLRAGRAQIAPRLTYTRRESDVGALFSTDAGVGAGTRRTERDELTGALALRAGLPFDAQVELAWAYHVAEQKRLVESTGGVLSDSGDTGHGLGDLEVGLAKALLRERGWRPDLVGRVTYDSGTGDRQDEGVSLPGGFDEVRASLTALKRQDPLVLVGTAFYETSFEEGGIDPGDEIGFALLAVLAASPETSLRLGVQQSFAAKARANGRRVEGSDQTQAAALFGLSSILGRGVFLDVTVAIGLTADAPDYVIGISLPVRFALPLR